MSELTPEEVRRVVIKEAWDYLGDLQGDKKNVLRLMGDEGEPLTYEAVRKWIAQGYMPTGRAKQFEKLSNGVYKREQFNPDFAD